MAAQTLANRSQCRRACRRREANYQPVIQQSQRKGRKEHTTMKIRNPNIEIKITSPGSFLTKSGRWCLTVYATWKQTWIEQPPSTDATHGHVRKKPAKEGTERGFVKEGFWECSRGNGVEGSPALPDIARCACGGRTY